MERTQKRDEKRIFY